jgi:diguanylate cyclase
MDKVRFRSVYEQSPIGVEIYDADGRMVEQNRVVLDLFGVVNPAEISHFCLFDDPCLGAEYKAILRSGQTVQFEAPFDFDQVKALGLYTTNRSGVSWLDLLLSPLKDHQGRISGYMVQVQDITERRRMEVELERERRHYALLMQTSRDAIHVLSQAGRLVDWNGAFLSHLGYSAEEAAHLTVADWDTRWRGEELANQLQGLLDQPRTFETFHRRKDGKVLEVEITAASFLQDGERYLYASSRDITARKQTESALRESEERYRLLFENMQEGFALNEVIFDDKNQVVDYRFLDANRAFEIHNGMLRTDIAGRTIREVLPGTDPEMIQRLGNVALTGKAEAFEYYSDAVNRYLRVHAFRPQAGRFATIFEDISQIRAVEAALRAGDVKYRVLFDNEIYAIMIFDLETRRIVDANAAFLRLYGYERDELLAGITLSDLSAELNVSAAPANLFFGEGTVFVPLCFHRKKDGTVFPVEITSGSYTWLDRPVVFSMALDISARIEAEKKLKESEERFRLLFENSRAVLLMIDPGSGELLDANPAAANYYGYTVETLRGMRIEEINTLPADEVAAERQRALDEKRNYFVFPHRLSSGEVRVVEVHSSPILANGKTVLFSIVHDITEREKMQGMLRASEARYRALFEQQHDAVFILDLGGRHLAANRHATEMLGYTPDEILQLSYADISAEVEESQKINQRLLAGEHIPLYERIFRKKDGQAFPVEINVELVRDGNGSPLHIQSVVRDISQRKQAEEELKKANEQLRLRMIQVEQLQAELRDQALHDPLTGLYNRRYLDESLEREIIRAERENNPLSVIVLDIDHFKKINDSYGHRVGDQFLVKIARLLENSTRGSDLVYRHGGEEFLLVLPGANADSARQRAEEIRQKCLETVIRYHGEELNLTISFGLAAFPAHGTTAEEIITKADKALYVSKETGRNRVTIWEEIFS